MTYDTQATYLLTYGAQATYLSPMLLRLHTFVAPLKLKDKVWDSVTTKRALTRRPTALGMDSSTRPSTAASCPAGTCM
jgi:hypothetical protein